MCIQHGGHCPVSVFYCVWMEGGWGRTKAAMSRSLEFNDVCGRVCVCVSVYVQKKGGGAFALSLLKSNTSGLVIWKGCCAWQTHRQYETERDIFIVRGSLSINLSLPCVDPKGSPNAAKTTKDVSLFG